jgi:hypothetical protein
MTIVRKLATRRALGACCLASVATAAVAVFEFGVALLLVISALVCVLTMAPVIWVAGMMREGEPR